MKGGHDNPTRIFVGQNYLGAGNFGDDLTLEGFLRVAVRHPGIEVSIGTPHDRAALARSFPQVRWLPDTEGERDAARRDADVWLGVGDTPFQLDSGAWLLDYNERERQHCAALGMPMYLLGVGCESREAAADPRSRALMAAAEHVWTRDEVSARMLRPYAAAAHVSAGADLAHLALGARATVPAREEGVLGLLLAFERREQLDVAELEVFLQRREPANTRWLMQEQRALPYLEGWILDELSPEARSRVSVMSVAPDARSIDGYLRAFGAPETVVTSRYHGALVAAWHGSKLLVVPRSAKLRGIAEDLGSPQINRSDSRLGLETALGTASEVPRARLHASYDRALAMCETFFRLCLARRDRNGHAYAVRPSSIAPAEPGSSDRTAAVSTRIFVGHSFFGAGNFGDELMLHGFLAAARRHPDVEITICTPYDLDGERRRFPGIRWLPDDEAVRDDALLGADLWVGLGGTPFQLDSGDWFLEHNERERARCARLGKPMVMLGVGCESAAAVADPRSVALLAALERVWTRDELSAATLRPFIDASRLQAGGDLAHLAFAAEPPPIEPGVTALLLAFERREQLALDELEAFIERRAPGDTRWLVQETRMLPYLERWIYANLRPAARGALSTTDFDFGSGSVEDYLRGFGAPETTVTSRYHGAVVAAWHRSRAVVVARSSKLRGIAEELGFPQIGRVGSHADLEAAVEGAVAAPRAALLGARARAARMCDEFFAACAALTAGRPPGNAAASAQQRGDPLPLRSLRASVVLEAPRTLHAGETVSVPCTVTNRGDAVYRSALPNPVQLCYRWYDGRGAAVGAGTWLHTPLTHPLKPGESTRAHMRIAAPSSSGSYTLAVTLLQEDVAWFDDVDPASGTRSAVAVLGDV